MANQSELDQRVLKSLTGRDKLNALLADQGLPTVRAVALAFLEHEENVSRCLGGSTDRRPTMERIRTKLSKALTLERSELDGLLGGALP